MVPRVPLAKVVLPRVKHDAVEAGPWALVELAPHQDGPPRLRRSLLAALGLVLLPCRGRAASGPPPPEDEVLSVIDGDTVKLAYAGRCRLIGVNTPETVAPRRGAGW